METERNKLGLVLAGVLTQPPAHRRENRTAFDLRPKSSLLHDRSCPSHEMENYRDYGKNEKNVDEESCDVKDKKTA
jgi:hypothetical protein